MAKKKSTRAVEMDSAVVDSAGGVRSARKTQCGEPAGDFMEVGKEVVRGMRLRCICRGHQGTIGRIAWSPCGRFIASPSTDKTIRIWDANDGKCLAVLEGHEHGVDCVSWSPTEPLLASASSYDKTLRIWEFEKPLLESNYNDREPTSLLSARILKGPDQLVSDIDWGKHGIACGTSNGTVWIWNPTNFALIKEIAELRGALRDSENKHLVWVKWSPVEDMLSAAVANSRIGNHAWTAKSTDSAIEFVKAELRIDPARETFPSSIAWLADSTTLLVGYADGSIRVCRTDIKWPPVHLEGHTGHVWSLSSSSDAKFVSSKSSDGTIRVWDTDSWSTIAVLREKPPEEYRRTWPGAVAFHPTAPVLATLNDAHDAIRIWDIDAPAIIRFGRWHEYLHYTSAKIVLVGESNVGKSCLAMRLAENRYPDDHEHGTTHGMRFWPMEADELHPAAKPPDGQRRDVVLWDFGGQDEYQLVHQMFLHDTTLALVLIDPTRGRAAMNEARDWNKRLEKHLGKDRAVKLLVGAKVDKKRELIDQNSIDAVCKECGFAAFLDLSAKTGRNTRRLRKLISDALDWDRLAKTSRPELFQHIRDDIERRRKDGEIVLLTEDLLASLPNVDTIEVEGRLMQAENLGTKTSPTWIEIRDSVRTVTDQLATQGVIVQTKLMTGDEALVLQLPVIERYAGSLIIAARNNPRGVPVVEERLLGSTKTIPLPGMLKKERLSPTKERMVLECIVELMIQHGICFRHGGLLVFPTLFPAGGTTDEKLPHSGSLYYDFTGAIDNIYASLVSKLMVSEEFGEGRLRAGRVEFDSPDLGVCGIRQIKRTGGLAHVDLFFAEDTDKDQRHLFTRFVERHLSDSGVDIREHEAIKCRECNYEISEDIIQENIARDQKDVICPKCRTHTLISEGVARIRERDPESDRRIVALRQKIEEATAKDATRAKAAVSGGETTRKSRDPIRLLHLSDLHFEKDTSPKASLQWLLQDLRDDDQNFPPIEKVEYLVLSGDVTHRGDNAGFDKARQFVLELVEELGLDALRCVFVPGNHDVQRRDSCYRFQSQVAGLDDRQFVKKADDVFLVRDDDDYPNRLKRFSDAFYHKVTTAEQYPLAPEQQGFSYFFEDTGVQFLALNTAWEIDQFFPKRASVHRDALANALATADKQVRDAIEHRDMKKNRPRLRIAVFHHGIHGPWAMQNLDFLSNLQTAGVKLCLHGDVHEMRQQWIDYWDEDRNLRVIGAGTFGAKRDEITEGSARSYNLLEIAADLKHARVYVREQPKPDGAWRGWNHFPDPDGGRGRVPFFDIELMS